MRYKLKYIERVAEPEIQPGDPRERGIRVHTALENYLVNGAPLPREALKLQDLYESIRDMAPRCEEIWWFDDRWQRCSEENKWLTCIQDVHVTFDDVSMSIDHKTGKRFGNELKHHAQMTTYSVANWCDNPNFAKYIAEFLYVDQGDVWSVTFRPEELERKRADLDREVTKMMDDKVFRPRPNIVTCKYCPYGPRQLGICPVGV